MQGEGGETKPVYNIRANGHKIQCKACGKTAIMLSPLAKYCSDICRYDDNRKKKPEQSKINF